MDNKTTTTIDTIIINAVKSIEIFSIRVENACQFHSLWRLNQWIKYYFYNNLLHEHRKLTAYRIFSTTIKPMKIILEKGDITIAYFVEYLNTNITLNSILINQRLFQKPFYHCDKSRYFNCQLQKFLSTNN